MKKYLSLISLLVLSLVSCTNEIENIFTGGEVTTINVSAEEFQTETRTSINSTDYAVSWNNGDMIGIFPMKENSSQIAFKISSGSGSSNTSFDGNGWGLKNGISYAAYYPIVNDVALDKANIALDYTGQTQNGNGNTSHLGAYDFLKTASTQAINGSLDFQFEHIGTLVHLTLDVPNGTYKKVELHTDGTFYSKAVLNLETGNTLPDEESETKTLTLNLNNVSVTDGKLEILTMIYPVDLEESYIYAYAYDEEGNNVSTTTWKGATFQPSTVWNGGELKVIPYLTFKADKTQTFVMSKAVETLEYSVNNGKWRELGTICVEFGGENGDLRLRGKSAIGTGTEYNYSKISFGNSTKVVCSGDIRTLIDYEQYSTAYTGCAQFRFLFEDCTSLITAPELPAMTLAEYCYYFMFKGCTSLKTAPELPATTLADYCYSNMFNNCASLTNAPELSATQLAVRCCDRMFLNTGIKEIPSHLQNTKLVKKWIEGNIGLQGLFAGLPVTDEYLYTILPVNYISGKYYLPATTLTEDCYSYMFRGCSDLITAPELPASILVPHCYYGMFWGCSKLNYIKMMATDISESNSLAGWTNGVSSTGTFVKNAAATWNESGSSGIPSGWTVKEEKPNNINGHDYVDLGITDENGNKVLWATTNVGADNPWDYGNYYAWGETKAYGEEDISNEHNYKYTGNTYEKTYYYWSTYKWATGDSMITISKYSRADGNTSGWWYEGSNYVGLNGVMNQTKLDAENDAAVENWGNGWRMPTYSELKLLATNCYWTWVTEYKGQAVRGCVVYKAKTDADKGKFNTSENVYSLSDIHIFLPAAGNHEDSSLYSEGDMGYYWSSELYDQTSQARSLYFDSDKVSASSYYYRFNGRTVRSVYVIQN